MPRLKAAAPDAAVIVVTGYSDLQGAIAALRQGATDYILKPLNADLLRTSLGRIAERRRLALAKERSEAAFRHLVEAAECMIVILRPDHTIVYFSPFAEQLHRLLGRGGPRSRLPRAARARTRPARCRRGVPAGHRRQPDPRVSRTRSSAATARARWIVWNARYLLGLRGRPRDPEGRARTSRSCKQAQERALQSERLAAIGADGDRAGPREPQRPAAQPGLPRDAGPGASATGPSART